ncbi:alpha/beta hydrolase [Pedobacter aquatilis]|uniref:alpha/beta hydrolase n=1 Tax=Pedobacter aquatilis TaxID=351343 RepID=UPI002930CB4D|nr:alpha/beta hydrolase [Pedobacter aquatilis]
MKNLLRLLCTVSTATIICLIIPILFPINSVAQIKNIVLVHGAFVDGSGWKGVYEILSKKGYNVSVAQQPLVSFSADSMAVARIINQQTGHCILVAHSYGGALITEAGNSEKVRGLVFIAAHAPDKGESEADNGKLYPSAYQSLIKGSDGWDYINPDKFHEDFAADLPMEEAAFSSNSQLPTADAVFHARIKNPAWRSKPSWYIVAEKDRIINPYLEKMYAKRAGSYMEIATGASHSVYITHAAQVASIIIQASLHKY